MVEAGKISQQQQQQEQQQLLSGLQKTEQQQFGESVSPLSKTIDTIERGELPSNEELTGIIDSTKLALDQKQGRLDEHGKKLVMDMEDVLSAIKAIILSANDQDRLQKFVTDVSEFTKDVTKRIERPSEQVKGDLYDALNEAKLLMYNIRHLLLYVIQSAQFRRFLNDLMDLFQDAFTVLGEKGDQVKQAIKSDVTKEDISVSETRESVKQVVQDVKQQVDKGQLLVVDEETKRRVKQRIYSLVHTLSRHREYNEAFEHMFNILDAFNKRMDQLQKDPNLKLEGSEQFEKLSDDARSILLGIFGKSFETFNREFWDLVQVLRQDKDASPFFYDFRSMVKEFTSQPNKLKDEQLVKDRISTLVDRWYSLYSKEQNKYGDRFNRLYNDFVNMMQYGSQQTFGIQDKLYLLATDLVTDNQGRPDLYVTQDSIIQLKNIMVPLFQDKLANIPIPVIEGSNDTYDFRFEDLLMDGRHFLPDHFHFRVVTDLNLSTISDMENRFSTRINLDLDDMNMNFKNIKFHYWRKTIPRIEDHGIANVSIQGLHLRLTWYLLSEADRPTTFRLSSIKSTIDDLKINIVTSNHSIIDNIVATLFPGYIKDQISQAFVDNIREFIAPINQQLNYYLRERMDVFHLRGVPSTGQKGLMDVANEKLKEVSGVISDKVEQVKETVIGKTLSETQESEIGMQKQKQPQKTMKKKKPDWSAKWRED